MQCFLQCLTCFLVIFTAQFKSWSPKQNYRECTVQAKKKKNRNLKNNCLLMNCTAQNKAWTVRNLLVENTISMT